jgi:short-subunit dehydrogenase
VLAARQKDVLDEVVSVCDRLGAKAIAVVTDVGDAQAIKQLAKDACIFGGSIDVWVNVAGIGALGEFTSIPIEVHDQIIRTNLIGYINGAHAVLPYFKKQGTGIIINVNSVGGFVALPYSVGYAASKFGVRGYSEALRTELLCYPGIHVCDVYPSFVDTPGPAHAANYTGKLLKPMKPVTPTSKVANTILKLAQDPKSSTLVGGMAYLARLSALFAPKITQWSLVKIMDYYFKQAEPVPVTNGSIFEPTRQDNKISGGYTNKSKVTNKAVKIAGLAGFAIGGLLTLRKWL